MFLLCVTLAAVFIVQSTAHALISFIPACPEYIEKDLHSEYFEAHTTPPWSDMDDFGYVSVRVTCRFTQVTQITSQVETDSERHRWQE